MAQVSLAGKQLPALFVYLAHSRLGYAPKLTRRQLVIHLRHAYGIPESSGNRFVNAFLAECVTADGTPFWFGELGMDGTVIRYGVDRFLRQIGTAPRMLLPLEESDLASPQALRNALYELVSFCLNRFDDGSPEGVTIISRAALQKLTGLSESSQRRVEHEIGIVAEPLFAYVARPAGADDSVQWLCQTFGKRVNVGIGSSVQIRNAFRAPRPALRILAPGYKISGEDAAAQTVFSPNTWSKRQLFRAGTISREVLQDLVNGGVDVDLWLGRTVNYLTGEIVGACLKLLGGAQYATDDFDAFTTYRAWTAL